MEHWHGRSRPNLLRRRQQSLCFYAADRNPYAYAYCNSYSHSNGDCHSCCDSYSYSYFNCSSDSDSYGDSDCYSDGHAHGDSYADDNAHSYTVPHARGPEGTNRKRCDF